jgi:hypothetical protein
MMDCINLKVPTKRLLSNFCCDLIAAQAEARSRCGFDFRSKAAPCASP